MLSTVYAKIKEQKETEEHREREKEQGVCHIEVEKKKKTEEERQAYMLCRGARSMLKKNVLSIYKPCSQQG